MSKNERRFRNTDTTAVHFDRSKVDSQRNRNEGSNVKPNVSVGGQCNTEFVTVLMEARGGYKFQFPAFSESTYLPTNQFESFERLESGVSLLGCSLALRTIKSRTRHVSWSFA